MSNIYIQEPPTHGKVLLETTVGDIDIELWSRETPKACRNFIQLCLEGYYDSTIFHRLIPGFIVQGGDPTGTGTGGHSIYGKPFKDEFHSRLRFVRRGLVALANGGERDDNGSQFFFTLGTTPELQNKHTIFGKVGGHTIYNMIKLEEGQQTDADDRPNYPHKILKTKVLLNPFDDIVPREKIKHTKDNKLKQSKMAATKNFSLLSFGEEAEDEEMELAATIKKNNKGKSSHDLSNDPSLSKDPAVIITTTAAAATDDSKKPEPEESPPEEEEQEPSYVNVVKAKLAAKKAALSDKNKKPVPSSSTAKEEEEEDDDDGRYYLGKSDKKKEQAKLASIKNEIKLLKKSMKPVLPAAAAAAPTPEEPPPSSVAIASYISEQRHYKSLKSQTPKKLEDREALTLKLLNKFKDKISSAKESAENETDTATAAVKEEEEDDPENPTSTKWLTRPLNNVASEVELAKDANLKSDDWFEIYDPRNPLNKRRREGNKLAHSQHEKIKKLKPID